jgi:DNA-binding MarR family transcriptional regulator
MSTVPLFSETYLYKVHTLSNILDKVFDHTLRLHAGITLSQFMVLIAIAQSNGINQRQVARYLGISAVAVKRQVGIAKRRAWIDSIDRNGRGEGLEVTPEGKVAIKTGLRALERHVFQIFDDHNRSLNLMQHLDVLLANAKEVLSQKQ